MQWDWKCDACGFTGQSITQYVPEKCPLCGRVINWNRKAGDVPPPTSSAGGETHTEKGDSFSQFKDTANKSLRNAFEFDKLEGFSLSKFMRQMLRKHSWAETEEYLSYGTPQQTPALSDVGAHWPAPWLFFRMILFTIVMILFIRWQINHLGYVYMFLPLAFFGVVGIPVSALMFFWEVNIPKNISIILLVRIMLISGFLSIIFTVIFNGYIKLPREPIYMMFAGPIEETAKLLTMLFFLRNKKYCYKLNGLLIGAAVGAGFAFIESGGYFISFLIQEGDKEGIRVMLDRAFCAPVGHVAYSALVGFGLWRVCPGNVFKFENLFKRQFLSLFAGAIVIHMLWNCVYLLANQMVLKTIIFGIIEYTIIIYLIQEGINEIRNLKKQQSV